MIQKKYMRLLKIIVSIVALLILFSLINFRDLITSLAGFNIYYVPILLFLTLFNIFIFVWTYKFLLKKKIPFIETYRDYLVAWAFGLFLPGKLGELGIIPVLKKKYGIPYKFSGPAVILPKISLLGVFILIALLFGAFLLNGETGFLLILFIVFILILVIGLYFLFPHLLKNKFLLKFKIVKDLAENKKQVMEMFSPVNLIVVMLTSFLRITLVVALTFAFYLAFNYIAPINMIVIAVVISQVVTFIPITMNGLGFREATFTGIMTLAGVPMGLTLGTISISLIISYGLGILIITLWNLPKFKQKNKKKIKEKTNESSEK
jgi:glycosyltransferase 2 family protein